MFVVTVELVEDSIANVTVVIIVDIYYTCVGHFFVNIN